MYTQRCRPVRTNPGRGSPAASPGYRRAGATSGIGWPRRISAPAGRRTGVLRQGAVLRHSGKTELKRHRHRRPDSPPDYFPPLPGGRGRGTPDCSGPAAYPVTLPQSAGPPRSISSPCPREGSTASRFSRTALGLPGRLTMRLRPRMPAAARESMARGVTAMDAARMASGMPEREPGAAGGHDEGGVPLVRQTDKGRADVLLLVWNDDPLHHLIPRRLQHLRRHGARPVGTLPAKAPVADCHHCCCIHPVSSSFPQK